MKPKKIYWAHSVWETCVMLGLKRSQVYRARSKATADGARHSESPFAQLAYIANLYNVSFEFRPRTMTREHFQVADGISFGRVCFVGTGIRVTHVVDRVKAGDSAMETLVDFGLGARHLDALNFALGIKP